MLLIKVNEQAGVWDTQTGAIKTLHLGRLSMQAAKHGPARQQSSPQHGCLSICRSFWCIIKFLASFAGVIVETCENDKINTCSSAQREETISQQAAGSRIGCYDDLTPC